MALSLIALVITIMKFILGKKQNMIQYFNEDGVAYAATLIEVTPNVITQIKTQETDGYNAVQVAFDEQKESRMKKPQKGHLKDLGNFRHMQEIRFDEAPALGRGDTITLDTFSKGDVVRVTSISKGKGFQGVVKRHGFGGGPRSHGQKHSEREPGSIGGGLRTRVPKGMRMAGRMGSDVITVPNLTILDIDASANQILVKGAIPGRRGTVALLMTK